MEIDAENTQQALIKYLRELEVVAGRVFQRERLPERPPTYPFATVNPLGAAVPVQTGDGQRHNRVGQQFQIEIWHQDIRMVDSAIRRRIIQELPDLSAMVAGENTQIRFLSYFRMPLQQGETVVRDVLTVIVHSEASAI
jgi:hypothetical protein